MKQGMQAVSKALIRGLLVVVPVYLAILLLLLVLAICAVIGATVGTRIGRSARDWLERSRASAAGATHPEAIAAEQMGLTRQVRRCQM